MKEDQRNSSQLIYPERRIIAVLLEIIWAEGKELLGFPYLAKKSYLVEKRRGINLFGFEQNPYSGVHSSALQLGIRTMKSMGFIRILEEDEANCEDVRNCYGEMRREHIAICSEQAVDLCLNNGTDNPDIKKWQKVINHINRHPNGKDWHTISIAVHLHSHRPTGPNDPPIERVMANIREHAKGRKIPLPKNVFDDACGLLNTLGLYQACIID